MKHTQTISYLFWNNQTMKTWKKNNGMTRGLCREGRKDVWHIRDKNSITFGHMLTDANACIRCHRIFDGPSSIFFLFRQYSGDFDTTVNSKCAFDSRRPVGHSQVNRSFRDRVDIYTCICHGFNSRLNPIRTPDKPLIIAAVVFDFVQSLKY